MSAREHVAANHDTADPHGTADPEVDFEPSRFPFSHTRPGLTKEMFETDSHGSIHVLDRRTYACRAGLFFSYTTIYRMAVACQHGGSIHQNCELPHLAINSVDGIIWGTYTCFLRTDWQCTSGLAVCICLNQRIPCGNTW